MSLLPFDAIDRLSEIMRSGKVVFFIGAGFSLDSESIPSTHRLIVRLVALLQTVAKRDASLALDVAKDFGQAFPFDGAPDLTNWSPPYDAMALAWTQAPAVKEFGAKYYEFNDWMVTTFETLLRILSNQQQKGWPKILAELSQTTAQLHAGVKAVKPKSPFATDRWASEYLPVTEAHLTLAKEGETRHRFAAGKTLLLDTMGFRGDGNCPSLMQGEAENKDRNLALAGYASCLRAKHFVLARMAREGWAPLLLTTNFDRLLEGAFRAVGLEPKKDDLNPHSSSGRIDPAPIPYACWTTVSGPEEFTTSGPRQQAQLVKIHGCSRRYEKLADRGLDQKAFQAYLRSLVFTYREIQNWREDAWSRDYLRTLLRTKTMVFSGYSGKDHVIHDTLRQVYEEMARDRRRTQWSPGTSVVRAEANPLHTPAYFSGDRLDFYSVEVLRAACSAVNGDAELRTSSKVQENFLPIRFSGKELGDGDHLLVWLWHRTFRRAQRDALQQEIRRLVLQLTGKTIYQSTVDQLLQKWDSMISDETALVQGISLNQLTSPAAHRKFHQVTQWTEIFHPGLLREMACMEAETRSTDATHWEYELRHSEHYHFPSSAHLAWTAWGALVEMALRELAKSALRLLAPAHPSAGPGRLGTSFPTLEIRPLGGGLGSALAIGHLGMSRMHSLGRFTHPYRTHRTWVLPSTIAPWPQEASSVPGAGFHHGIEAAPVAKKLWEWALSTNIPRPEAEQTLGLV